MTNISAIDLPPAPRIDGWTPARQRRFCEVLSECGRVDEAARAAGMSRESAYRLRRRAGAQPFALAWDAALLCARDRLIDTSFELALDGSVTETWVDGKLVKQVRRRDARQTLAIAERIARQTMLGTAAGKAVAREFEAFLDCMEADANAQSRASAEFLQCRADWGSGADRPELAATSSTLKRAALRQPRLEHIPEQRDSV